MARNQKREPSWWQAEKGKVSRKVLEHVQNVERAQSDIYERFLRLAFLYNPNGRTSSIEDRPSDSRVTENVVASNVDTVHAAIAATDVRARFMTDDGDFDDIRRSRHLEWYGNGLAKKLQAPAKGRRAFKDAALKGTGAVKVWIEGTDIRCERLLIDNIVVDEAECREGSMPRQMHYREIVTVEEAKARFPGSENAVAIEAAIGKGDLNNDRYWADYRPIDRNEVVLVESWFLPIGIKGTKSYVKGRHTIVLDGYDLLDETWEESHFPIVWVYWSEPDSGWYGISLAERIAGMQRQLNKMNLQEDLLIDRYAFPTTYYHVGDAHLQAKTMSKLGTEAMYKVAVPTTVFPPAGSPDLSRRHAEVRQASYHESGVSELAARAAKPAGFDSGAALREYRDASAQRFAQQEKRYEYFQLQIIERLIWCAKKLGRSAPEVVRRSRYGARKFKWADVDMGAVAVQIQAASDISQTPAGRRALAMEWAQAGVISKDDALALSKPLGSVDVERTISLYTASQEHIDTMLEDALDGMQITPEPYMNLKMAVWRGQMRLQQAEDDGAPEDILESLRQFTDTAAWMVAQASAPAQPMDATMGGDPMAADSAGLPPTEAMAQAPAPAMPDMGPALTGAGVSPLSLVG